jgi:NADH:ubiquinone oxidoreductase subunit 5 (subunit L)/multisubunit Na+/H+ antiporter MnhA subunit
MLLVPGLAGLIAFVWPQRLAWVVHALLLGVAGWLVVTAAWIFPETGLSAQWPWLDLGSLTLTLDLTLSRFGAVMALFIGAFGFLLGLYCVAFTKAQTGRHHAYMLWSLGGALAVVLANHLIVLLIGWEITTLMLYLLIGLGGEKAKAGAAKTFAILGFSDCAMLLAIILMLFDSNNPNLTMSQLHMSTNSTLGLICFLLLLVSALAKAGAMPFHTWIPSAAKGSPTDVMAFLPAALDKLLGIYLLARVSLEFFEWNINLKLLLMLIGVVTIMGAVMMALIQDDLKTLLAYQAIAQVGYIVLGIGTGSWIGIAGAIFHMINHAIYKSCLFMTAGSVERQTGTTNLSELGGLAKLMPLTFIGCVISALALSGVPPMNSFSSKWLIYQACLAVPSRLAPLLVAAAVFGSALTLACFIKIVHSVFLGSPSAEMVKKNPVESPIWMTGPILVLSFICVFFGVFATLPLRGFVAPIMETLGITGLQEHLQAGEISALSTLWNPALATVLLLLAFLLGIVIYMVSSGFKVRQARIYIGGEKLPPQAGHYSGTTFYNTVRAMPFIRAVFRDAEKESFDVYRFSGRFGGSLVNVLRSCQTGVLPLYISWVVLGLVLIVVYIIGKGGI